MRMRLPVTLGVWLLSAAPALPSEPLRVSATDAAAAAWDVKIEAMQRDGSLRLRKTEPDTLVPGRVHQRLTQLHRGVPVFGAELVRQSDGRGAVSVFGSLYEGIDVDATPRISAEEARSSVERLSGVRLGPARSPELMVLPKDEGGYALAWRVRAATPGDVIVYFVDAQGGGLAYQYSDLQRQSVVGVGTGVLGERKKMAAFRFQGTHYADDRLRPPAITTFDLKGDFQKILFYLNGFTSLTLDDYAKDADNDWTDGASVDAHTYSGYTYDYYFKRFGRRGLDGADLRITSIVHPVNRSDEALYSDQIFFLFYLNAFYFGDGIMVYGEGSDFPFDGKRFNYFSAALDVVAHELTHGVTDYTSRLIYNRESGALNEAFSDIMGIAVEFFFQPAGSGPVRADYLLGEDIEVPGGTRNAQDPRAYGYPDHYSIRFLGSLDGGGVHINSSIASHAFYLAIEGGANRTSGIAVQGVGASNRDQIEKAFYRAFTQMLPPSANFSTARAATIQAARDLYGAGSPAERALTQAWNAVGVS